MKVELPGKGEPDKERRDLLIERLAQRIARLRLEVPAILFLEMNRPLTFLASQGVLMAAPILGAFLDPETIEEYSRILDSEESLDRLIGRIEELATKRER